MIDRYEQLRADGGARQRPSAYSGSARARRRGAGRGGQRDARAAAAGADRRGVRRQARRDARRRGAARRRRSAAAACGGRARDRANAPRVTFMIVDDSPLSRMAAACSSRARRTSRSRAAAPMRSRSCARSTRPTRPRDIVFADIVMPVMDGVELLARIQERTRSRWPAAAARIAAIFMLSGVGDRCSRTCASKRARPTCSSSRSRSRPPRRSRRTRRSACAARRARRGPEKRHWTGRRRRRSLAASRRPRRAVEDASGGAPLDDAWVDCPSASARRFRPARRCLRVLRRLRRPAMAWPSRPGPTRAKHRCCGGRARRRRRDGRKRARRGRARAAARSRARRARSPAECAVVVARRARQLARAGAALLLGFALLSDSSLEAARRYVGLALGDDGLGAPPGGDALDRRHPRRRPNRGLVLVSSSAGVANDAGGASAAPRKVLYKWCADGGSDPTHEPPPSDWARTALGRSARACHLG